MLLPGAAFAASQFSFLDPAYTQEIFTAPQSGLGLTFANGLLVTRDDIGGNGTVLQVYGAATQVVNGTTVHSFTSQPITPLVGTSLTGGRGMTTGTDGFIYLNNANGIDRVNPTTYAVTNHYSTSAGPYGIAAQPNGNIVHVDSVNRVWSLNPTTGADTLLYTAPSFIDGASVDPATGTIFLADLGSNRVRVLNAAGALINDQPLSHAPDGMAFGGGGAFANNTDGTITKLTFAGPGFTGAVTETLIASGGAYGDFATVGPDGAFYVTQYGPLGGIHWVNGATTSDTVISRIQLVGGGGFDPTPGGGGNNRVPDSGSTLSLLGASLMGMMFMRRRLAAR